MSRKASQHSTMSVCNVVCRQIPRLVILPASMSPVAMA